MIKYIKTLEMFRGICDQHWGNSSVAHLCTVLSACKISSVVTFGPVGMARSSEVSVRSQSHKTVIPCKYRCNAVLLCSLQSTCFLRLKRSLNQIQQTKTVTFQHICYPYSVKETFIYSLDMQFVLTVISIKCS
jgi:hypothetical protein